ncbi:MAG: DUF1848 domain-containing protein [Bacilli bacterium]|nr:DUF1848 domain-containing protein [Bacilli bacterium]
MILNVSGRTDIVAFYTKWFINRLNSGYFDVRNPIYPKNVSRIYVSDIDLILFCTKNPIPILPYLDKIDKPIVFHITLTPYKKDIEPNVLPKGKIIEAIKQLSKIIGKENVYVRYDPIFLSDKYNINYHIKAFDNMCSLLNGYVNHIIVSFIDDYKNVRKNKKIFNFKEFNENDYELIGKKFSESARKNKMYVQTCCEENNLIKYGFIKRDCIGIDLAFKKTGKYFKKWNARGKECKCVEMVDIGVYNSCSHFCKYCYANFDEEKVFENKFNHDPNSSLLIGKINDDDIIKIRK